MKIVFMLMLLIACTEKESIPQQAITQHAWFKKPDQIEAQLQSWGIYATNEEKELYFSTIGMLYGATDINTQEVLLHDSPVVTYVMALNAVSEWVSRKLVERQRQLELINQNKPVSVFMFKGVAIPAASGACDKNSHDWCFAAASQANWCDCDDEITIGRYTASESPPQPDTAAERKRIMHNMQDIGEFLGVTLDNCSPSPDRDQYQHLPHYLLDAVFLPALAATDDSNMVNAPEATAGQQQATQEAPAWLLVAREATAWQRVIHSMLLSGEFFMHLDPRRKELCQ